MTRIVGCKHGDPVPEACLECLDEAITPKPRVTRTMTASFTSRCAAVDGHTIDSGSETGYVRGVGWCCRQCYVR